MNLRRIAIWISIIVVSVLALPAHAQNTPLTYGQRLTGLLSVNAASATYSFTGVTGDFVLIEAIATSPQLDPTLTLLSPNAEPIATNNNGLFGFGSRDAAITLRLPEDGVYLIVVGRTPASATEGGFLLRLDGTPLELESLPSGQVFEVLLDTTTPTRSFEFSGGTLVVAGTGVESLYKAEVFDAQGVSLVRVNGAAVQSSIVTLPDPFANYSILISITGDTPVRMALRVEGADALPRSMTDPLAIEPLPTPTLPPDATVAPTNTPLVPLGECIALAQGTGLNVRTGPATEFDVFVVLPPGETVTITGVFTDWFEVELLDGNTGWVSAAVIQRLGDCSAVPQATPPAQ